MPLPGGSSRSFTHLWQKRLCYCFFSFFLFERISPSAKAGGKISGSPGLGRRAVGSHRGCEGGRARVSVSGASLFNTKQTHQRRGECVLFLGTWGYAPGAGQRLLPVPPTAPPPVHRSAVGLAWLVTLLLGCEGGKQPWQLLRRMCRCICLLQLGPRAPTAEGMRCRLPASPPARQPRASLAAAPWLVANAPLWWQEAPPRQRWLLAVSLGPVLSPVEQNRRWQDAEQDGFARRSWQLTAMTFLGGISTDLGVATFSLGSWQRNRFCLELGASCTMDNVHVVHRSSPPGKRGSCQPALLCR